MGVYEPRHQQFRPVIDDFRITRPGNHFAIAATSQDEAVFDQKRTILDVIEGGGVVRGLRLG